MADKQQEADLFMSKHLLRMVEDDLIEDNYHNEFAIGFIVSTNELLKRGRKLSYKQSQLLSEYFSRDYWPRVED